MALIDDFKSQFPEFETAKVDSNFPAIEAIWPNIFNRSYENNEQAVLHLIAHLMVQEIKSGSAPARLLQSKSAGSVSGSYYNLKTSPDAYEEWLRTTKYGQIFLLITSNLAGGGVQV